jgi:fatty acid amide hydrolase 2
MQRWLTMSGTALARAIRTGDVRAREVVAAHIAQIRATEPRVNAVVADRFDAALDEADEADACAGNGGGDLPPFHGVPCTVKECIAVEGMPWSAGLVARRAVVADTSATTAERLRAAGAINLGATNISELCMWMESSNRIYGRTRNPYDETRTCGGSSGGQGAVVGAGGVPFGIGADIGGSIRMPAFFCGVFGHKPTGGLVPTTGHFPAAENEAGRYLTLGPIARRAEDLMPLLRIIAGPDGFDGHCGAWELGDPATVSLADLEVHDVAHPTHREMSRAKARAVTALADAGARVRPFAHAQFRRGFEIWSAMLDAATDTRFSVLLGNGRRVRPLFEVPRLIAGRSPHTVAALGLAALEVLPALMPKRARALIEVGQRLREQLVELLGDRGVLVFPSFPTLAPKHHHLLARPFDAGYTAVFNVMELPVTQVPLGLSEQGLPLGAQVVAGPGRDHLAIAVALELERAFGGWVPPGN